ADLDHASFDQARDLRLDRELLARLDLADGDGLLGDRALLDGHQLVAVVVSFSGPRPRVDAAGSGDEQGQKDQNPEEFSHATPPGNRSPAADIRPRPPEPRYAPAGRRFRQALRHAHAGQTPPAPRSLERLIPCPGRSRPGSWGASPSGCCSGEPSASS